VIFNAPNTKKNRIAALIAIGLGLGVGFFIAVSAGKDDAPEEGQTSTADAAGIVAEPTPATPTPPAHLQFPASKVGEVDFESYSQDLARFVGLEIGESRLSATDKIRLYFIPEDGRIIRTTSSSFELPDGGVLILGAAGLGDDSVKAEEVMAIFEGPEGAQTLAAYGMKIKCYRGSNTTEWQTELCP